MTDPIKSSVQSPDPGDLVDLYELDLTTLGGSVVYFTSGTMAAATKAIFKTKTYEPWPIEAKGFDRTGAGPLPTPRLAVANVDKTIQDLTRLYNDFKGAKVTRRRTFRRYLDNGATPDATAEFPPEIYYIERRAALNRTFIEFELRAQLDLEGVEVPRRRILRDFCGHTYRVWNGAAFVQGSCPYAAAAMFDINNAVTVVETEDDCARKLTSCRLRFGDNGDLPTRAFPGVSQGSI